MLGCTIEDLLEKHKDEDPQKYQEANDRLNNLKDRLQKVGKDFRGKCPLGVRIIRDGKKFFKKHGKMFQLSM